jgi:FMN-dependent NADH-azoreductase
MSTLLRIDASSRHAGSHSRALGDAFEAEWRGHHPGAAVVRRDLAATPVPHIADATIAGFYTAPEAMTPELRAATALSDALIAELMSADVLLITTPMYNFSVPSALKAWVDQIVRIGKTFSYDGIAFTGLVTGRRAIVACAYGAAGYGEGAPLAAFDLLKGYLQLLLGFLGFTDINFVVAEATTSADASVEASVARVSSHARELAEVA